ncbi:MAG TPA: hypothetical protein DC047_09485 [Blastocatellia bacterium]|nr:hypothetical protein [Blastocatellia bacterium]
MNSSTVKSFAKKLACPSSNLLLSFSSQTLAPEINFLVKHHLAACDFCYCEIPLLSFYTSPQKGETRTPELPLNLRALAESILLGNRLARAGFAGVDGERGFNIIEAEDAESSN